MVRPRRTYLKLLMRSVRGSLARFLSILGIVTLGAGLLAGLLATTPDMQLTAHEYVSSHRMMDINIKGTMGLTQGDAQALLAYPGVTAALPCHVTDVLLAGESGEDYVARVYGVPMEQHGSTLINDFELVEGRLPQNGAECLLVSTKSFTGQHELGEVYSLSPRNAEPEALADTYSFTELAVVGLVHSPNYMSMENEPSSVGTGAVQLVLFAPSQSYALDVYTDIFLTIDNNGLNSYTDEYTELAGAFCDGLEPFGKERSQVRLAEIKAEAQGELDSARAEYEEARAEAEAELEEARQELADATSTLAEAEAELEDAKQELSSARGDVSAAERELEAQVSAQRQQLEATKHIMLPEQYQAALAQLEAAYAEGQAGIASARAEIASAETELSEAEAELSESRLELSGAQADFNQAEAEAKEELAKAGQELADAQAELDGLETPEWVLLSREDTVSYSSYKGNTGKVAAIARIFPLFMFLVAALVALTTMTRMVEEDRAQIGVLKALGYSTGEIMAYYLAYSAAASLLGCAAGMAMGFNLLPHVINQAYGMMYTLPRLITVFRWDYAVAITMAAVGCTTVAALAACLSALREQPSTLMRPKTPQPGKRIFLEHIRPLWRRLKFSAKVTARNIFRYKKRLYMTVVGIAGCTALMLTGFGLRDSISGIVNIQFGELYSYDMMAYASSATAWEEYPGLSGFFTGSEYVGSFARVHTENVYVEAGSKSEPASLYVPQSAAELARQITLRERKGGAPVPFGENSVVITEKMAEKLGLKVGDTFTLRAENGKYVEQTVSGITENYVTSFVFMGAPLYREGIGREPEFDVILADITAEGIAMRDSISEGLLAGGGVAMVSFNSTIQESFQNTLHNIDYIIIVLIIAAGALAVIVVYNLTNINISERKKELATIKVLGFYEGEVARYIYRETTWLALMGTALGLGLGVWLHSFVIKTAEVDSVMFGRSIEPLSFLLAAAATLLFTLLVDLVMLKKIRSIDMVESMKANE